MSGTAFRSSLPVCLLLLGCNCCFFPLLHPAPQSREESAGAEAQAEALHWAEHPAIVASVLQPGPLLLRDVPLEAPYGR